MEATKGNGTRVTCTDYDPRGSHAFVHTRATCATVRLGATVLEYVKTQHRSKLNPRVAHPADWTKSGAASRHHSPVRPHPAHRLNQKEIRRKVNSLAGFTESWSFNYELYFYYVPLDGKKFWPDNIKTQQQSVRLSEMPHDLRVPFTSIVTIKAREVRVLEQKTMVAWPVNVLTDTIRLKRIRPFTLFKYLFPYLWVKVLFLPKIMLSCRIT